MLDELLQQGFSSDKELEDFIIKRLTHGIPVDVDVTGGGCTAFVYTDEILRLIFELRYTRSCKWVKPVTDIGKAKLDEFYLELKELRKH